MLNACKTVEDAIPVVRFTRPSHTPGIEIVHYPNLTRGWRGVSEGYR